MKVESPGSSFDFALRKTSLKKRKKNEIMKKRKKDISFVKANHKHNKEEKECT